MYVCVCVQTFKLQLWFLTIVIFRNIPFILRQTAMELPLLWPCDDLATRHHCLNAAATTSLS